MNGMSPAAASVIRRIRKTLPDAAFQPNRARLVTAALHTMVVGVGYAGIRLLPPAAPLLSVVIGHSLACLAFVGHEISHNAVVRHRVVKYLVSLWVLGINVVSPTMWNRLHNDAHHRHASTIKDPDRPFLVTEQQPATLRYAAVFYPARENWRANVLVFVHLVSYITRNIVCVFYPDDAKPAIITSKPAYRRAERWRVAAELGSIAALQWMVWIAVGRSWWNYVWASPAALCVASAVIMTYVFTNHFLNPITHDHDPIAGTTSVVVPKVFDVLHSNFSYHTEHHLFPSLNSDYYPQVSALLKAEAPEGYQQVAIGEAWKRLWEQERFREMK